MCSLRIPPSTVHISSRNRTEEAETICTCGDWRRSKEAVSALRKGSVNLSDPRQVIRYSFRTSDITAFGSDPARP
jgi:hypothetical protein